jgi:CSLREA domain-containing protein
MASASIPSPAQAAVYTITVFTDDNTANGNCTLREAVRAANTNAPVDACPAGFAGPDTIILRPGAYSLTVTGPPDDTSAAGDLDVLETLHIVGQGANVTSIDAGGLGDRLFDVRPVSGNIVSIDRVTLTGGTSPTSSDGGAIANRATVFLEGVYVAGNTATQHGGGLYNNGGVFHITGSTFSGNDAVGDSGAIDQVDGASAATSTITNSTLSGNSAGDDGGAITASSDNPVTMNNVTITGNRTLGGSSPDGGGVYAGASAVTMKNTIVAGNTVAAAGTGPDCTPGVTSQGYNIIGNDSGCAITPNLGDQIGTPTAPIDPILGRLEDNGGGTPTHELLPGSPAIDAGGNVQPGGSEVPACEATDQRGLSRFLCDVGAYEWVLCNRIAVNIIGTEGRDKLRGTGASDGITGLGGKDTLNGKAGKDALCGGRGRDKLKGGGGKDILDGDVGKDTCIGGGGRDKGRFCEKEKKIP